MSSDGLLKALNDSQRYLDIVHKQQLGKSEAEWLIETTVSNFAKYYNSGFIEYRKSVAEAGDFAAVEWTGRGATFKDVLGREYIDCLGGFGLFNLGWAHPKVVGAVQAQLEKSPLPTQELLDPLRGMLAHLLAEITPGDIQYSFFVGSGTEAVEGAMKLAKLYTRKSGFIASVRGFHGKTTGSLALTGKAIFRRPAMPLHNNVFHVPYGDADAVEQQLRIAREVGNDIAAVIMEPVQGEAGAIVPPDDFWPRLRQLCDEYEVLLIADEVQTGMGRTGKLFGYQLSDIVPDIMTLGKGIGGGVPLAAMLCREEIACFEPGDQGGTYNGNPLMTAVGVAVTNELLQPGFLQSVQDKGAYLSAELLKLASRHGLQGERGEGLLRALKLSSDIGPKIVETARDMSPVGLLLNSPRPDLLRFMPALTVTTQEIDQMISMLSDVLKKLGQ